MAESSINRPVHLALRDKNYEEVLRLFKYALEGRGLISRKKIIAAMEEHIVTASQEAGFAARGIVIQPKERDFVHLLRVLLEEVTAADKIVGHEEILNRDNSFLNRFLAETPGLIHEFLVSHEGRAAGIINGLKVMVWATEKNYLDLKQNNFEALDPDEQRRYNLMYRSGGGSRLDTPC
jgi:hypothetical protein